MNTNEVNDYLLKLKLFTNPQVSLLGKGESNINYLATDGSKKYVVRTARKDVPAVSRQEDEHHFMLFIEARGVEFAPRSLHYDKAHNIHIVSYIEGQDTSVANLTDKQTEIFIEQLKELNSITYDDYLNWCKLSGQSPRTPETLAMRKKVYIEDRLQTINNASLSSNFAKQVDSWASPKIRMLHAVEREANLRTVFLHNDLRWTDYGGNLKISGEKLYFIDWELSGFFAEAVPEIGDVIGSIPYNAPNKRILHRLFEGYIAGEPDLEQLHGSIRYGVLWGKLGNPLWAAERYCILASENYPEVERYRILAENGMKDAERFFNTPYEEWFI